MQKLLIFFQQKILKHSILCLLEDLTTNDLVKLTML